MPTDSTVQGWGLLGGQVKERKVEFRERYWSLQAAFPATPGKCQRAGRMAVPLELTLTTWYLIINGAHSWRKHCSSGKHPYWRSNQKTQMYRRCLTRGICASLFLLSLPKSFLNILLYFLWPLGPSCLEAYNKVVQQTSWPWHLSPPSSELTERNCHHRK